MSTTCETCACWVYVQRTAAVKTIQDGEVSMQRIGACQRMPPVYVPGEELGRFPLTTANLNCREWKPRLTGNTVEDLFKMFGASPDNL